MFEKIKIFKNKFANLVNSRIKFIRFRKKNKGEKEIVDKQIIDKEIIDKEKKLNMQKVKETRLTDICSNSNWVRI